MSIRILHVGDAHLGARCVFLGDEARIRERQQDFRHAFATALQFAADPEHRIDLVAVAGDLFDTSAPEPALVEHVAARFRDLRDRGIEVFVVPGTHDTYADPRSVYRQIDDTFGARVLCGPDMNEPVTIELHGEIIHIYGMAVQQGGPMRPLEEFRRADGPGCHMGLVHASLVDIRSGDAQPAEPVISRDEIARSGLDYLALGHFHNFQRIECGRTVACYPGSIEGKKFGENGSRCVALVELAAAGVTIEQVQTNRRSLIEIEIEPSREQIGSTRGLVAWIEAHAGSADIVRVRLRGAADFPVDADAVAAGVTDRFFHFELVDDSSIIGSARIKRISAERTVRGMFARKMSAELDGAVEPDQRAVIERALRIGLVEMGVCENDNVD